MALQATAPVFEWREWEDEGYVDLPDYFPKGQETFSTTQEDLPLHTDSHPLQNSLDEDGSDDSLGRQTLSSIPPLANIKELEDELWGVLPDPHPESLDPSSTAQYNFRPAPREANRTVAISTWVDQDQSGNYDPSGRALVLDLPVKRRREPREPLPDGAPKRPKTFSYQSGRFNGFQLPITFTLTSDHAKAKLTSFGNALDNWPDASVDSPSTSQSPQEQSGCHEHSLSDDDGSTFTFRNLRTRERRESAELQYFDGHEPCSLTDLTLGFPAARGCKWCNALGDPGNECPLLKEGAKYPCATCREDDIECELIVQPIKKRACEACGRKRLVCSYRRDDSDHSLPCKDCANAGLKCVAGPASGRTRMGPAYDKTDLKEESFPEKSPRRNLKSCTGCSNAKKWCSVKNKHGKIPCNRCVEHKIDCIFVSARRTIKERVTKGKVKKGAVAQEELEKPTEVPRIGKFKTIVTSLAHPIMFNYISEDPDDPMQCHWCDDAVYGLLGLGEKEVEVVDNDDGQGYTEVVDGHIAGGYPPSRMCGFCTLDRLRITACKVHEIEFIDGMDPENFDHEAALDFMQPGNPAPFDWCSICPMPAFFACCKKLEDMGYQQDEIEEGEERGCGLALCESCAVALVNDHGGELPGLLDKLGLEKVEKAKVDKEAGRFLLRADADFLHPDGELLGRMAAG